MGLLKAIMDAILGSADEAGGQAVTKLTVGLAEATTASMTVESTLRFGEYSDGLDDARLLVDGEIITATGRTSASPFTFTTLTRGVDGTTAQDHPIGTLVLDISGNRTALDHVRRGFLVDFAVGADLDVIARNLGMKKCPSINEEQWRRIIKAVAYLPKTTVDAFDKALEALRGDTTSYEIIERLISNPYMIFVEIEAALVSSDPDGIRGRFVLTGNHPQLTDGLTQVSVTFQGAPVQLQDVRGVYLDTVPARRGYRDGLTNYYSAHVGGSDVITLSPSPGAIGTEVLVDFTAYGGATPINYHYLGHGFGSDQIQLAHRFDPGTPWPTVGAVGTIVQTVIEDDGDRMAYLSDPLVAVRCLLNQIRQAGVGVSASTVAP